MWCQTLKVLLCYFSSISSQKLPGYQPRPNLRNLELHGPIQQCYLFCPAGCRIPKKSTSASAQSFFQAAIHSCEVLHAHRTVYFYNTVSYAVGFLAFTGTNKGLNIIYIQDTVEGVENLIELDAVKTHWLSGCRSEVVMLDRLLSWLCRRVRRISCRCPLVFWSMNRTLNVRFLDLQF